MSQREEINTPLGILEIDILNGQIVFIGFQDPRSAGFPPAAAGTSEINDVVTTGMQSKYQTIFDDYFKGRTKTLDLPYNQNGTEFQIQVWKEICKIPYGSSKTYSEIATAVGRPKAYRAVANICGQNKIPLIVPCHRVVGKSNQGGYRWGLPRKCWLLNLEKSTINS